MDWQMDGVSFYTYDVMVVGNPSECSQKISCIIIASIFRCRLDVFVSQA